MLNTKGENKENNVAGVIYCSFMFVKFLEYSAFYNLSEKIIF